MGLPLQAECGWGVGTGVEAEQTSEHPEASYGHKLIEENMIDMM